MTALTGPTRVLVLLNCVSVPFLEVWNATRVPFRFPQDSSRQYRTPVFESRESQEVSPEQALVSGDGLQSCLAGGGVCEGQVERRERTGIRGRI